MLSKNHEIAHVAFDPVVVAFACKESVRRSSETSA
jgi:hypothetical protein